MSNSQFQNYIEQIANGQADPCEILKSCALSDLEKQALLQAYADSQVDKLAPTVVLQEFKGHTTGGDIEVPAFFWGYVRFTDTDNSLQIDLLGTTEYATDSDADNFSEEKGDLNWDYISGRHYKARTITIPAGITANYLFILK